LVQCQTLQLHCPVQTAALACRPSVVEICPTLRLDCVPSQGIHLCQSHPQILCGVSGAPGCGPQGPGPLNPGQAAAAGAFEAVAPEAVLHLRPTVLCPIQTHFYLQCHPTILCHTQQIFCALPTLAGCSFPTQACPSGFCPSAACGGGGFGGANQF